MSHFKVTIGGALWVTTDIYCHDDKKYPDVIQWINVNGFHFEELAEFLMSTFGVDDIEIPKEKPSGKKAAKKSIKTLSSGASGLPDSKWNESWLNSVSQARRLKMLDDGSIAPPFPTSLGDFYGFMHDSGYSFFHCYAPERDLYFTVYSPEWTPEHINDFEATLSREELRLAEYIEAARVATRRRIGAKLTGARFAGLEVEYGESFDDPRHVYVALNVTYEEGPGDTSCDCFRVALSTEPSGEPEFDHGYVSL